MPGSSRKLDGAFRANLFLCEDVFQLSQDQQFKQKILVADDSEMNRSILADMLGDEYEIIEAENGLEALAVIQKYGAELSLVLLDIVMPELDGFGVLTMMNKERWIEDIPVIMISSESGSAHVERAYELGCTDFISRPFDALIVHRRVVNTILLYAKQKRLIGMVADQIYEKVQRSNLMIDILSCIVEFRNGESGQHVRHVHILTELLLKSLVQKTKRYQLSLNDISLISTASALHDIGKICIAEDILNKPGKLTDEEFAVMKTHAEIGANILKGLPIYQEQPLIRIAYEICRWHHERYDGRGYPDGLRGDEIPISAQIVALADVYDALTSERVYKNAIPHSEAIQMILKGQCGAFNPQALECLVDIADSIQDELDGDTSARTNQQEMRSVAEEMLRHGELTASERTLQLLEHERMKYNFFADMSQEIQFEYTAVPPMVTLSAWGAEQLGLDETIMDPMHNKKAINLFSGGSLQGLLEALRKATLKQPIVTYEYQLKCGEGLRWFRIIARVIWNDESGPYTGVIGKAIDIHDSRTQLSNLEAMATRDSLTGLLNHASAKKRIIERMEEHPDGKFALVIFDLDHFKSANDTYGHIFGDRVLNFMAEKLRQSIRSGDIAARAGGDEFLIFLEYKMEIEPVIQRIFSSLVGKFEDFTISVSMGIAETEQVGTDYEDLFHAADQALYTVKRSGRGQYYFYNDTMKKMLSAISPINGEEADSEKARPAEEGGKRE